MSEWTDLGAELAKARKGKGLELADVHHVTRVPVSVLRALEENNYSVFASAAYAKSFLQQYGGYVGVEVEPWLESFDTVDSLTDLEEYEYLQLEDEEDKGEAEKPKRRRRETAGPLAPTMFLVLTLGLLALGFWGAKRMGFTEDLTNEVSAEESSQQEPTDQEVAPVRVETEVEDESGSENPEEVGEDLAERETRVSGVSRAIVVPEDE